MNYRVLALIIIPFILEACFTHCKGIHTYYVYNITGVELPEVYNIEADSLDFSFNKDSDSVDYRQGWRDHFEFLRFKFTIDTEGEIVDLGYTSIFSNNQVYAMCAKAEDLEESQLLDHIDSLTIYSIPIWDTLLPNQRNLTEITTFYEIPSQEKDINLRWPSAEIYGYPNSDSLQLAITFYLNGQDIISDTSELIIFK